MRRSLIAMAALMTVAAAVQAQDTAASWPAKPVRVVVPFPASGATDLVARTITQRISQDLGQQMIVDNKPGAGGTIGAMEAAKAAPDGYTVLFTTSSTHSISPHLMSKLSYNPVKDFTPVAHLADAASILLVTPSLPVKSVAELIQLAKQKPAQLNYASSGNGTIVHLNGAAFAAQAGIELTHVPYKGTSHSITDLAAGQVHMLFDSIPTGVPHVQSGRLKALAVTGEKRSPLAPDVPTVSEAGLPGFTSVTWFGVYLPAGASPALVERVNKAFTTAVKAPEVQESLRKNGLDVIQNSTPAQFDAMVKADSARWGKLIKQLNISQ